MEGYNHRFRQDYPEDELQEKREAALNPVLLFFGEGFSGLEREPGALCRWSTRRRAGCGKSACPVRRGGDVETGHGGASEAPASEGPGTDRLHLHYRATSLLYLGVWRCNYVGCGGLWRRSNTATGVEKWRSDFLAGGVLSGSMNQAWLGWLLSVSMRQIRVGGPFFHEMKDAGSNSDLVVQIDWWLDPALLSLTRCVVPRRRGLTVIVNNPNFNFRGQNQRPQGSLIRDEPSLRRRNHA
jgi:hypothetical protein